jgi:hypothetical protein
MDEIAFIEDEKEIMKKACNIHMCKLITHACFKWAVIATTAYEKVICTKALVACERNDKLVILAMERKIKSQKKIEVETNFKEVAFLPRKWFYVYNHENADNYYATIVDDSIVAFHEGLDFLLWFVKKNWRYYYKKHYKDDIVFLLGHYISEYIELEEFKKKFGIDLRNCKPVCFAEK